MEKGAASDRVLTGRPLRPASFQAVLIPFSHHRNCVQQRLWDEQGVDALQELRCL
jgi:hypothetical protein